MNTNIKIAFFGTPEFSSFVLEELLSGGYTPTLIVTTPDKPAGRGLALTESPVKRFAIAHNISIVQPEKLDTDFILKIKEAEIELLVVAAYGKILPLSVLSLGKYPPLNVHPSLLPKYRGTSPVETQILEDEKNIGVSVIQMDSEMDHGPIVVQKQIEIPNWPISRDTLNNTLWRTGGQLLVEILPRWRDGTIEPTVQDHTQATFTKKMTKENGLINLSLPDRQNYLKFLAYEGWPGTFFFDTDGKRIKITQVHFADKKFIIDKVIPEGKKEMDYKNLNPKD